MNKTDSTTTVQEMKDTFAAFLAERGWNEAHMPRNLAISIAIEAAELMEHFQWRDLDERDRAAIADELADIISYCLSFAMSMNIDISTAFHSKLERVKQKYPTDIFRPGADDKDNYRRIKQACRTHKHRIAHADEMQESSEHRSGAYTEVREHRSGGADAADRRVRSPGHKGVA